MALQLLYHKAVPGEIGEVELDARLSESHSFRSVVTRHPIENGAVITDHIINEPEVVTMTGFITNSPVRIGGRIGQAIVDRLSSDIDTGGDRVKSAFTTLTDLWETKVEFTVVTGLKTYRRLVFQSLEFPIDNRTGDSLRFIATMTRITRVSSKVVPIENLAQSDTGVTAGTSDTAADTVDKGKQTTSAASATQTEVSSTAFKIGKAGQKTGAELLEALGNLFK